MPSPDNLAVIAAAGSHKTEFVVSSALAADHTKKVLITTYTNENLAQVYRRIHGKVGCIPSNITLMSWYSFLISHCARPYQHAVLAEVGKIRALNFTYPRSMYIRKANPHKYYLDDKADMFRDSVSEFACQANEQTKGLVIERLERGFDEVYIDEVQDLVGYDLELLDLLFASSLRVVVVGDPRQHTFATNQGRKNKKYRGAGFIQWLKERASSCALEERAISYRCNQPICDFADSLYSSLPPTISANEEVTGHDGVFSIRREEVPAYIERYRPTVLRDSRRANTMGYPAINIGVAKGSTYERVLIFPTVPMTKWVTP